MSDFKNLDVWKRAFNSISANIAEGAGRLSTRDFIHFLSYARGSATETLNLLMLSEQLGYIDQQTANKLKKECNSVMRMLNGLISSLRNKKDKL